MLRTSDAMRLNMSRSFSVRDTMRMTLSLALYRRAYRHQQGSSMRGSRILRDCGGESGIDHESSNDERGPMSQDSCPVQDLLHGLFVRFTTDFLSFPPLERLNRLLKPALGQRQLRHSHLLKISVMKSFQRHKCRAQRAVCQHWNRCRPLRLLWRTYAGGRLRKSINCFVTRVRLPSSSRPIKNHDKQ